jgi:hypothetical protein
MMDSRHIQIVITRSKWIATVKNKRGVRLLFTAVDKCIIQDHEYPGRGRCDGMLTSEEHLYLIELKDSDWATQTSAKEQLISTIQFLREHHPGIIRKYRHRKAFVCNKKRPFYVMAKEENLFFFRTYEFRLDVQAEVVVV